MTSSRSNRPTNSRLVDSTAGGVAEENLALLMHVLEKTDSIREAVGFCIDDADLREPLAAALRERVDLLERLFDTVSGLVESAVSEMNRATKGAEKRQVVAEFAAKFGVIELTSESRGILELITYLDFFLDHPDQSVSEEVRAALRESRAARIDISVRKAGVEEVRRAFAISEWGTARRHLSDVRKSREFMGLLAELVPLPGGDAG